MKKFTLTGFMGWILLIAVIAMGAKIGENALRVGDKTGVDVLIEMGNGQLKWDNTTQKMQFSNDGGTSIKDIGSGSGGAAGINLLENADFESGNPPGNWTASAGTFIAETASPGFGNQSGSWDAAAASDTLDSDFQAVPAGLEGRSCNTTVQYKYATGASGDYKLQVIANTGGLIAEKDIDLATDWREDALQFTCPSSDSIKIRVESQLDGGVILLDNASLGKTNFVNISQTELVAHAYYPGTASCDWTKSGSGYGAFPVDTDCPSISVLQSSQAVNTTDDNLPNIVFDNLRAGSYYASVSLGALADTAGAILGYRIAVIGGTAVAQPTCGHILTDNDLVSIECSLSFTTTGGAVTLSMEARASAGTARIDNRNITDSNLVWTVQKFPGSSAEALTLETTGGYVEAVIAGPNFSLPLAASAATSLTDAGQQMFSKGSIVAEVPCSGANPTGDTCSGSDEVAGVAFVPHVNGPWLVCGQLTQTTTISGVAGNRVESIWGLRETNLDGSSIIAQGTELQTTNTKYDGATASRHQSAQMHLCSIFNFADVSKKRIEVEFFQTTSGAGADTNALESGSFVTGQNSELSFIAYPLSQQFPTPVFTDLQNSLNLRPKMEVSAARQKEGFAKIGNSGTPNIQSQTGAWIDSLTDSGVGITIVTFKSGFFSGNPICNCTNNSTGTAYTCNFNSVDNINIDVQTKDHANTFVDTDFYLHCVGAE